MPRRTENGLSEMIRSSDSIPREDRNNPSNTAVPSFTQTVTDDELVGSGLVKSLPIAVALSLMLWAVIITIVLRLI